MPQILSTSDAPLVRTDFSNPAAWRDLLIAVRAESEDGFLANISVIDDPAFQDAASGQGKWNRRATPRGLSSMR